MTTQGLLRKVGAASFRARLLAAMMVLVCSITAAALSFAQRNAAATDQRNLQNEFQSRLGFVLGAQEVRLTAIAERCRTLARSLRIRAAIEEGVIEDLYLNAEVELRDVLERRDEHAREPVARSLRAKFFRFLNAAGQPMAHAEPQAWEAHLALPEGALGEQQVGYVLSTADDGSEALRQTIATPIITTDTGAVIGSVVLGFDVADFDAGGSRSGITSGIWFDGRLHAAGNAAPAPEALERAVTAAIQTPGASPDGFTSSVNGLPHLVFFKTLNPGSHYAPAYQVCIYPLADSLARQQELRWKIAGAAALVLCGSLFVSHFISGQLSAPVERLAEDSVENIAQRQRAETALGVTEQKYRGIFDNAVEGIFQTTPEGRYLDVNPALARMYGYATPEEMIADLTDIDRQLYVEPGRRAEFVRRMHEEGSVTDFESQVRGRDGRGFWISENARRVRDEANGEVLTYEGMVQDITERKRAADQLLALNAELKTALENLQATQQQVIQQERLRALGQMASGIAHDFNNALVPILGFTELLQLSPQILTDPAKSAKYLDAIQTSAKDAASVVSRLREFYRPDKNDRAFAPVNLKRLVEQAITLTRPKWKDQAQANGATVSIVLELEAVPPVAGEESPLREVLTNLIFNAVDAMPDGGTLTLRTRCDRSSACLEIADTGTGMTEEVRQRCLEPFFSTKGERGTGLGLAMVFGIVQRHSGKLDLESAPGHGTTFRITLPLMDAAPERTAEAPSDKPARRSLRVLVVDDEAPIRDTLGAVLAIDGHEVESAVEGADGLKRFIAGKFDLVLTDKAMPGMNGDQMAAAIKRVAPRTPIILLTGFGLFHDKSEFPDIDVLASKPIRIPALREAIASALLIV